jgi:hypothetical protein
MVTDGHLGKAGEVLASASTITLDRVNLVYGGPEANGSGLKGLADFLSNCGQRINFLCIECTEQTVTSIEDLRAIAHLCPLLDGLEITMLKMVDLTMVRHYSFFLSLLSFDVLFL